METAVKRCLICGETKPLGAYHANASRPDGLHVECKVCRCARERHRKAAKRASRLGSLTADLDAERLSEAVLGVFRDVYDSSPGRLRADLAATLAAVDPGERLLGLTAFTACRAAAQAVVRRYDWCEGGGGI